MFFREVVIFLNKIGAKYSFINTKLIIKKRINTKYNKNKYLIVTKN